MEKIIWILLLSLTGIAKGQAQSSSIDSLLATQFKPNEPGGVLLVARNGRPIYKKAFGMANIELQVPMTEDMVFYIASLTKQFTAVAILQLYEQGKLSLQDTIGQYIPTCPPQVAGITIERLLNHTSGLADKIEGASTRSTVAERVLEYLNQPVLFKAGSKWNYNNVNYLVLGYIIEKLTGQSYKDHMINHIFKPAGMQHTYVCEEEALIMKRTAGYMMNGWGVRNDKIPDMRIMYAAGGIMSTAADMLAWNNALHAGKLLKKETLARAFAPARLLNGTSAPYGYGWHIENIQGSLAYRHGGSLQGFVSEMAYLPGEDVFVVLLLNMQSKKHVVALHRIITAMTTGKRYALTETSIDSTSLPKFRGVYTNQLNEKIIITLNGRSLQFQRPGGRLLTLEAASPTDFFIDEGFVQVQFHLDSTQKVTSLTLSRVGLQSATWKKTE